MPSLADQRLAELDRFQRFEVVPLFLLLFLTNFGFLPLF